MDSAKIVLIVLLCSLSAIIIICLLASYFISPFKFPYKIIEFDVSGTRNPDINDYIDRYIIENRMIPFDKHLIKYKIWKDNCRITIDNSIFKNHRRRQFYDAIDENRMFVFIFLRERTRYRQVNYVRHAYKVIAETNRFSCSYDYISVRYNKLKSIDFETTMSEYESSKQRNLMTKSLRETIAKRDNYTCQICGKYMPDGVGLHIDHIVPIAKGGKSIPSNLQVLCSKCNGKKSSKL